MSGETFQWTTRPGSDQDNGRLGDQVVAIIKPHEEPFGGFMLDVLLPGCGGERFVQYADREMAKQYFRRVVLPEWLKKTGLTYKTRAKTKKKEIQ